MPVQMLYFAWVRERIGVAQEVVTPPEDVRDVAGLIAWLASQSAGHAEAFAEPARLRAAVDQEFVALDAAITGAREIAVFPPVTGG